MNLKGIFLQFYVGGMGAKTFNVHKDHVSRMGFAGDAEKIQELFMQGKRDQAIAAVPDQLVDRGCGPFFSRPVPDRDSRQAQHPGA